MSEHDIADCPRCGKRDYVLKEDNIWVCLNCPHTSKMPISGLDPKPETNSGMIASLIAAFIIAIFVMIALNRRSPPTPIQGLNPQPQSQY